LPYFQEQEHHNAGTLSADIEEKYFAARLRAAAGSNDGRWQIGLPGF
jgi:hypothetical protein